MKPNSKKSSKSTIIVALCSLFTSIAFVASAICARCAYINWGQLCNSTASCANGLAFYWSADPPYNGCEVLWQTGETQLECFEYPSTTPVTITYLKPRPFDGSACPGCDWVFDYSITLNKHQCWSDDTGCGGNG